MLQIARFAMFGGRNMVETQGYCKRSSGYSRSAQGDQRIGGDFRGTRGIHPGQIHPFGTIEQFLSHWLV